MDVRIKAAGADNVYCPPLIPGRRFRREALHVERFSPELAVVTEARGRRLEERAVIRPTRGSAARLAGHLDGVRVAELVRRRASPHAGLTGDAAQLGAGGGGRPCCAAPAATRAAGPRSASASVSASQICSPARHSTTISARSRPAVDAVAGVAHDGDDLLDRGLVRGVAHSPVARRPAGVEFRQRGG
jgi:hypothetical protein